MKYSPNTEERVWAVLSHISTLAFGMGIFLPIIGWSEQRRKSKYASFQCLQALGYQSLGYTIWILVSLLVMVVLVIMMAVASSLSGTVGTLPSMFIVIWSAAFLIVIFGMLGIYILLPIFAAIACALGRDFRYPILGNYLVVYLEYDAAQTSEEQKWLNEEHEDRWVAAAGHFSVIIVLWGMLAPLTSWILQAQRSAFLKYQSIQTFIYQIFVTLLFFGTSMTYVVGAVILVGTAGPNGDAEFNTTIGIVGLVIFLIFSLIATLILLIVPLFHILGQWAGYRVLKGDDYHYPILGKLVADQWMKP